MFSPPRVYIMYVIFKVYTSKQALLCSTYIIVYKRFSCILQIISSKVALSKYVVMNSEDNFNILIT